MTQEMASDKSLIEKDGGALLTCVSLASSDILIDTVTLTQMTSKDTSRLTH